MIHKTSLNKFIYYQEINSFLTFPPPSWRIFKSEFIIYGDTIIVYQIILSLGSSYGLLRRSPKIVRYDVKYKSLSTPLTLETKATVKIFRIL